MEESTLGPAEEAAGNREAASPAVRKPYRKPKLLHLGSLRELTQTTKAGGANDGRPNRGTGRGGMFQG